MQITQIDKPILYYFLICSLTVVAPLSILMYLPSLPELVNYFNTTVSIMNISLYGFYVLEGIGIILFGPLSDNLGRKKLLIALTAVFSIACILSALSPDIIMFLLSRFLVGFSCGGIMSISLAMIKDCSRNDTVRSRLIVITFVCAALSMILGPILGARLIESFSWHYAILFPIILTVIGCFVSCFMAEPLKKLQSSASVSKLLHSFSEICKNKSVVFFIISIGLLAVPYKAYVTLSPFIFEEGFNLSATSYSILLAVNSVTATICSIFILKVCQFAGNRKVGMGFIFFSLGSSVLILLFGGINAVTCLLCCLPCVLTFFCMRQYSFNIMFTEFDDNSGAVSSLIYVVILMGMCVGTILSSLPWCNNIFGLGMTMLIGSVCSLIFWVLLKLHGMRLKGLER